MSLVVNNERDAQKLVRAGYRSYDNPDGQIETDGRYDSIQGAREGARGLSKAEPKKEFSIVRINTDKDFPYDVVYRERRQLKKEDRKKRKKELIKKLRDKHTSKEEREKIRQELSTLGNKVMRL